MANRVVRVPFFASMVGLLLPAALSAQGPAYVQAHYTKTEHQIPMRDGARLFTAVYTPKDTSQKYPILMIRTQSGIQPYGADQVHANVGPSPLFGKEGYIFVYQDIRGRWMSEGTFINLRPHNPAKGPRDVDESSDTYDTIDWLLKNVAGHNGKVGHYGTSYRGFLAAAGAIDAHPALKAVTPQAPVLDNFAGDDWRHNGATFLAHAFYYAHRLGVPRPKPVKEAFYAKVNFDTPDGYDFFLRLGTLAQIDATHFKGQNKFWTELIEHATYDEHWRSRNLRPHLKNLKPALLTVGGWFDAENLFGVLEAHRCFEADRANNVLVMGPWIHGGWNSGTGASLGPVSFGANTAEFFREKIELPFFNFHLKGQGEWQPARTIVFETGANRWREFTRWPPEGTKPLALDLRAGGRLVTGDAASATERSGQKQAGEFDEYLSDPRRPVPYIDKIGTIMMPEYMCADQRFAARRPDVLVYESEPLAKELTLAGPIAVELHASTTGTDSDWIVKLIDVYPNDHPDPQPNPTGVKMGGYQQLVRGDVMRGRFRNSLEKPEPFEPGRPTAVTFKLLDVLHTFRPGHKIMVQVHSTWFPLVERNPQTFVDIARAKDSDFQKATQRVYRSKEMPSRLVVQVLP
jgi:putative CocE/NonD family hydrolase